MAGRRGPKKSIEDMEDIVEPVEAAVAVESSGRVEKLESFSDRDEATPLPKSEFENVTIDLNCRIKVKRTVYHPGRHTIPRHLARTILEMADKKRRADLAVFTGNQFIANNVLERSQIHERQTKR